MTGFEKRKSPRIIPDLVSVEVATHMPLSGKTEVRETCTINNVSEAGMLFESAQPFKPWEILRLTFGIPHSSIVIRTEAIVIHVSHHETYRIGVQFKSLAIAEHRFLREFIAHTLGSSWAEGQAG